MLSRVSCGAGLVCSRRYQARLVGGYDGLCSVTQTELGQDAADVRLGGLLPDHQSAADLGIR